MRGNAINFAEGKEQACFNRLGSTYLDLYLTWFRSAYKRLKFSSVQRSKTHCKQDLKFTRILKRYITKCLNHLTNFDHTRALR